MSAPFWKAFGPGLLWASAAIGVSHLVQSTRAGADGGFALAWVILAALILKYPFFEFGPRYAAATGESLVEGYLRVGRWALWLYLLITVSTAVIVQVAVVLFTAFVTRLVFGLTWSLPVTAGVVVAVCAGLLMVGRFRGLDLAAKAIIVLLSVSTLSWRRELRKTRRNALDRDVQGSMRAQEKERGLSDLPSGGGCGSGAPWRGSRNRTCRTTGGSDSCSRR